MQLNLHGMQKDKYGFGCCLLLSAQTLECFIITVIYLKMRRHQPSHSTSLTGQWLKTVYHIKRKCKRGRFLWKRANLFEPTQQEHTTFCLVSGLVNISDLVSGAFIYHELLKKKNPHSSVFSVDLSFQQAVWMGKRNLQKGSTSIFQRNTLPNLLNIMNW